MPRSIVISIPKLAMKVITSGLRLGTPALSSREMGIHEMETVADFIMEGLSAIGDSAKLSNLRRRIAEFARQYPAPGVTDAPG